MLDIKIAKTKQEAKNIGDFLTSSNAFDQTWAPAEKKMVQQAPVDSLKFENHRYWYIEDDGRVIAAMGVRENKYGSSGYEMNEDYLAVHQDYRRKGLASKLLKEVEKFVKERGGRYIHVLSCDIESYEAARLFYLENDYEQVAKIPDYYVKGEGRIDFFKKIA
ncbi:MAG: GNAT family N-acetyltransferase [Candidatus Woesebacteria bacterium]|jgi:ribosomal protein S18 acetylase RimI-like enzyme